MKIFIKNMVCPRCIAAVRDEAEKLGLKPVKVSLGDIELNDTQITPEQLAKFENAIRQAGFELIDEKKNLLVEKVKSLIRQTIHHSQKPLKVNWSGMIADELHYEYNYISNLFSAIEGSTIEQYIIKQKVEKVKELLAYDELSLSEIAWEIGYSSNAYLTNQFKKVTGMTPGTFRNKQTQNRKPIDNL